MSRTRRSSLAASVGAAGKRRNVRAARESAAAAAAVVGGGRRWEGPGGGACDIARTYAPSDWSAAPLVHTPYTATHGATNVQVSCSKRGGRRCVHGRRKRVGSGSVSVGFNAFRFFL